MLFGFEKGNNLGKGDAEFIDQICIQMGFNRESAIGYLTGVETELMDHYPEIGFFRDCVFMFKLVMDPSSSALPELKSWKVKDSALKWSFEDNLYKVCGFGKALECTVLTEPVDRKEVKKRTLISRFLSVIGLKRNDLPRVSPSKANPSILIGERVDTEDDILHIRKLPNFDGTLGARDCELMLQFLTAPYLRIPLMLHFFTQEHRLKALLNRDLQEVLDAALFEPGLWQEEEVKEVPDQIPAPNRDSLSTSCGLLFNEIILSPNVILTSIHDMLLKCIEMDTGKYSELGESILYVLRLSVRVEGFLIFLIKNREFHAKIKSGEVSIHAKPAYNGAYQEADVRGLSCSDEMLQEAVDCQKKVRHLLDNEVFKILIRWIKKCKEEDSIAHACMLHAHLAYLFRNVESEQLDAYKVFALLGSQVFISSNLKYDLDHGHTSGLTLTDIRIPHTDLLDMFQRNRNKMLAWMIANSLQTNKVLNAVIKLVDSGAKKTDVNKAIFDRNWISLENIGYNLKGRFVPANEFDLVAFERVVANEGKANFYDWMLDTTTTLLNTEVNVQLGNRALTHSNEVHQLRSLNLCYRNCIGEFMVKKNQPRPLDMDMAFNADFQCVFK